jgi:hypothetical protein
MMAEPPPTLNTHRLSLGTGVSIERRLVGEANAVYCADIGDASWK